MKKLLNFKFSIFTCIILFTGIVLFIVSSNKLNDYNLWNKIFIEQTYQMWLDINSVASLTVSAMIPLTVMVITLETNTYINSINNGENKKINYRNMNKQNSEVILREIKQFYEVICYICDLRIIEYNLGIDIFQDDYEEIISEEVRFLTKLKEDFFYDDKICKIITNCIDNKHNVTIFVQCCIDLYKQFYGFDDQSMELIDRKEIQEKALKALYAKCFWDILFQEQFVKERTVLYLKNNYLMRSNDKEHVDLVIEHVKLNKGKLDLVNMLGEEDAESIKVIESNEFIKLAQVYNNKDIECVDKTTLINLLDIYQDLYEQDDVCNITYDTIGKNDKDDVDYFVKNFKLDTLSDDDQLNYTIDNFKIHRYI